MPVRALYKNGGKFKKLVKRMNLEKYLKKVLQSIKIVSVERQLQLSKETMEGELDKKEESGRNIIIKNP